MCAIHLPAISGIPEPRRVRVHIRSAATRLPMDWAHPRGELADGLPSESWHLARARQGGQGMSARKVRPHRLLRVGASRLQDGAEAFLVGGMAPGERRPHRSRSSTASLAGGIVLVSHGIIDSYLMKSIIRA